MWGQLAVPSNRELDVGRLPGLRTLPWGVSSMEITGRGGEDQALGVQSTLSLLSLSFKCGLELFSGLGSEGSLLRPAQ